MNLLLIDDDECLAESLTRFFGQHDFDLVSETHPLQALEYLRQHSVELILLDVMLPGIDGFETCRRIRQFSDVPIIMLTARGDVMDRVVAQGEMEQPIAIHGSTEFKQLATGINDMALQIKFMLENKHQLLLAISHELRSPLTRAKVNLALMVDHDIKQALVVDIDEMEGLISRILESERLNQRHTAL